MLSTKSILAYLGSIVFLTTLFVIGYETPREEFSKFILLFIGAFACFYGLYLNPQKWKFAWFIGLAIAARLILLMAAPELSNDFYRFIWDGELITRGINPYAHTPNEIISQGPLYSDGYMRMLYHGMGELSQGNYSCYPVFNQLLFYFPASLSDSIATNVIILKVIILLADIGSILVGRKILKLLNKSPHLIWIYALNPFIILEFSGNLHFEGVMIFFILLAIYYLLLDKWLFAAIFFGIAVQIKLIPLILLPFILMYLKWQRSLGFTAMVGVVVLSLGAIMLNTVFFDNMMQSIQLYFQNFEFNASVYYVIRALMEASKGYNDIALVGPILGTIATIGILLLALFKRQKDANDLFTAMLFALVIYYGFATTVHPWYISMILIFSIFSRYKFALLWSLMIMFSYAAYQTDTFTENLWLVAIEYIIIFGVMIYEIVQLTKKEDFSFQLPSFFQKSA